MRYLVLLLTLLFGVAGCGLMSLWMCDAGGDAWLGNSRTVCGGLRIEYGSI